MAEFVATLILVFFTMERSEWVIMSRQDLLPRERAEPNPAGNRVFGGFHQLFGDKGHWVNILSRAVIVKSVMQQMELI